ncbi:MTRF1L release factor glutamine methyltransferase isoform X1 [Pseudophryne corroboree]|uniref:MTRF1L release factor glutamine methyltransferase isoform X1 n=1 Tax=Pseudophryne corroboree TaxID=495146 RepID=UPI00308129C1
MPIIPHILRRLLPKVTQTPAICRRLGSGAVTAEQLALHWQNVFQDHGIPEPVESSEILVAHILGAKTFHSMPSHLSRSHISAEQLTLIEGMAQERLRRVPVQYIIGEWDFLDMTLQMRPPVFIPRPETEELVGLVVADCAVLRRSAEATILEVGCGSGAVSLALLRSIPQARLIAVDKTEAAVNLTRDNAERLGLQHRIHVLQHDVLSDPTERLLDLGPVDVVVSNPPYIFTEDMSQLEPEILRYEDHSALDGGPDGMDVIKGVLRLAHHLLSPNGDVFLEVDPRHPDMVEAWLCDHPEEELQLLSSVRDFCGKSRFLHIRRR